jgi:decaprenylphospho-beta-D-ribofuranose 2-oxidase
MHPLDSIDNWNYAYGKNGFIQYQFVVPSTDSKALQDVLDILRTYKVHSFLCVLKKFGPGSQGFLSFPMEGWTMTIDISKNHSKLFEIVSALDEKVIESSGRVYLAKDSFLTPWKLTSMYEHLDSWLRIKRKIDPENLWRSDQGRRVGLC